MIINKKIVKVLPTAHAYVRSSGGLRYFDLILCVIICRSIIILTNEF